MNNNYIPTIGIEVHVELKTNSKAFSPSINNYNALANTNVNEIDLGYPGTLPTVNEEILHKAIKACLALNCTINKKMHFDRKNYYYPDLPKGFQITQARTPIGRDGYVEINLNNEIKKIEIEEIHMEEDTCKSLHVDGKTLLNYNRAGVPLIEIVSKPVMKSAEEVIKYLEALRENLFYLDVSDCKIEEGSMRADVNVSVSKTNELGTKCEVKNIGSISNAGVAVNYEVLRQISLLENGLSVINETRKFDSKTNTTVSMRKKEIGNDYRYFPEPDIPYLYLSDKKIEEIKKEIVFLPKERRKLYLEKGISEINIDKLISNKEISDFLNRYLDTSINFKIASNILLGDITFYLNKNNLKLEETKIANKFISLVNMLDKGIISSKIFKDLIDDIMSSDITMEELLKQKNISLISNTEELESIIKKVLCDNVKSVEDYKSGKENAFKFLMGMVMKETKGSANPKLVNELLIDLLSKSVN